MRRRAEPRGAAHWLSVLAWLALLLAGPAGAVELPDFRVLVREQGASVVNISTARAPEAAPEDGRARLPDYLQRLLPGHPEAEPAEEDAAVGSGFIIDPNGYILTNAHVVEAADAIEVRLKDKRSFAARLVGSDARSDIALIKIDADGLPAVRLGRPDAVEVGEWVVAIGSPFGFENSVTAGIVSARGRVFPEESLVPFIQTDVAINPGNSGGPLFNLDGEVIGVNSQIYSRTGGFMGVSFAIPIDIAMQIQAQLRAHGEVRRGRIGVSIQEVTAPLARAFGLERVEGALVGVVEPDSPAHRAGVRTGDVVLRFGEATVRGADDLPRIVGAMPPGSRVPMSVWREGQAVELRVTVGQWASTREATAWRTPRSPVPPRLGLELVEPSGARLRSLGAPWGLEVKAARGPAAQAEIVAGDVLVASVRDGHQQPLRTLDDFDAALAEVAAGEALTVLLQRGPARSFVALEAGR